jgi:phosphatidylglycerol:prolipoprotein diacylglycerol transferase
MLKTILHIYGPFSINSFGTLIAIGVLVFIALVLRDPRAKKIIAPSVFIDTVALSIVLAILGGRLLFFATEGNMLAHWQEFFLVWSGGFSILGTVLAVIIGLLFYLRYKAVPIVPYFDLVAVYAPLLQGISRIGCFLAGCCHGMQTQVAWAISYTDTESIAPLYVPLHPTQLYSAGLYFGIFLCMYFCARTMFEKPGQLFCMYLMLMSLERFSVDFFRGDRDFFCDPPFGLSPLLSINQWIALGIFGVGVMLFVYSSCSGHAVKKHQKNMPCSS